MQQPVPVFVLFGFHFLIKASVVICFAHSEHLLQDRNSRLISFENQAAMYAIFSSANWNLFIEVFANTPYLQGVHHTHISGDHNDP